MDDVKTKSPARTARGTGTSGVDPNLLRLILLAMTDLPSNLQAHYEFCAEHRRLFRGDRRLRAFWLAQSVAPVERMMPNRTNIIGLKVWR
jgi:hypothetical protein